MKFLTQNFVAIFILLAFIGLAVIYSIATPPFEAGDESRHYAVVKYMADEVRLPVQEPGEAQIHWSHEGNQPPLYYNIHNIFRGSSAPKIGEIVQKLKKKGFRASRTHFTPIGLRCDAPLKTVKKIK